MSVASYQPSSSNLPVIAPSSRIELAHHNIDISKEMDRQYLQTIVGTTTGDVDKAWLNFRRTGEVRYAVARSAHIAGYTRLKAVKVNAAGQIVKDDTTGVEAQVVAGISSRYGGVRALVERYYTLMKVPGQAFMIRLRPNLDGTGDPDGFWFLSADEIMREGEAQSNARKDEPITWRMTRAATDNSTGTQSSLTRRVRSEDFFGRVWVPDPQYTEDAQSPMQAVNSMCEQLYTLTENISARLRSRFAYAGILLIPNEINDAAISGATPSDGLYSSDRVMNYLIHVMTANMLNVAQGLPTVPIVLKGPAAVLDKVRHLLMEATVAETDLKLRAELIDRILTALDQQKQSVQGGEGTSHWGMWAVSDEERRITVTPDIEQLCHLLDRFVLWPALASNNRKPGDVMSWRVWYDLSGAAVRSNMQEDVRQAWDRGVISDQYLRTISGIPETAAPGLADRVHWAGLKVQNPVLMLYGLAGIEATLEDAKGWATPTGPAPDSAAGDPQSSPGKGDPGSPSDSESDTPKSQKPG